MFPTEVEWTLDRTERALALLGDPHRAYASMHVGGTNGKGSVTTTLASVMLATGRRTGCYVSPHLVSFTERIRVDGAPVREAALAEYAAECREAIESCGLTFFEAVTVLALHSFAREGVEVAALEVGLGGRLDATNVVSPLVSAVTNVALDHADYLGETLPEVAREKAGIIKPGVPFVTTETDSEVLALFESLAREVDAPFRSVPASSVRQVEVDPSRTSFRMETEPWGELALSTPLVGRHQAINGALSVEVCAQLPTALRPSREALVRGVGGVAYRGRDEIVVLDGRTWLLDVAHNPAGVGSLVDTLDRLSLPRPLVALVGILADKDWGAMLPPLMERCTRVILTQPPSAPPARRWEPQRAAASVGGAAAGVSVEEDFAAALEEVSRLAGDGTVVVTGSVHTVGGAMEVLGTIRPDRATP